MCSGSDAGSYLRLIDFVYLSTLGLRVVKKKKGLEVWVAVMAPASAAAPSSRIEQAA